MKHILAGIGWLLNIQVGCHLVSNKQISHFDLLLSPVFMQPQSEYVALLSRAWFISISQLSRYLTEFHSVTIPEWAHNSLAHSGYMFNPSYHVSNMASSRKGFKGGMLIYLNTGRHFNRRPVVDVDAMAPARTAVVAGMASLPKWHRLPITFFPWCFINSPYSLFFYDDLEHPRTYVQMHNHCSKRTLMAYIYLQYWYLTVLDKLTYLSGQVEFYNCRFRLCK